MVVRLVFPVIVDLAAEEYILIKENLSTLDDLGIEIDDFGKNSIIVRALPDIIQKGDIAGIIKNIAYAIKEDIGKVDFTDLKRKIAATIACHHSLRAHDKINSIEIKTLLQELEKNL